MIYNIVADAKNLSETEVKTLKHLKNIVALDGAANFLLDSGIVPEVVVGDLDSAFPETLKKLENIGITIKKTPDQSKTDLEKGIEFCDSLGASEINIYNAFGQRIDHSIFNLRILKSHYLQNRKLKLHNKFEYTQYIVDQNIELSGKTGDEVAIIAFPQAVVSSSGLKYEMQKYELKFAYQESISNSLKSQNAQIQISGEALVILSDKITSLVFNVIS